MAASSLSVAGVAIVAPKPSADFDKVMKELGTQFKLEDAVVAYLITDVGVQSLEDLAALFSGPEQIRPVVDGIAGLPEGKRLIQTARLRQAWEGVSKAQGVAEQSKKKGDDDPDLDTPLQPEVLDSLNSDFWKGYHLHIGASEMPADSLVSSVPANSRGGYLPFGTCGASRCWPSNKKA